MNRSLIVAGLVITASVLIFPFLAYYGNHIMVITSTSMSPALKPNDMIIVEPTEITKVKEGDIIAFDSHMKELGIIAHRAINVYEDEGQTIIETKGDNVDETDPWHVKDVDFIGIIKEKVDCDRGIL